MQMCSFLFVLRRWEQDRLEFERKLYYFNAIGYPLQLLLFPEGGDLTPRTMQRSNDFARENKLPAYQYCIHPRTTGFLYVMNAMRDGGLDAVYDMTIAYPDKLPKTELDMGRGHFPREVHFHVRAYENSNIPEEQEPLKEWLNRRWEEKEARLKEFYTHKEFRDPAPSSSNDKSMGNGSTLASVKSPEVRRAHNIPFLIYSVFVVSLTNALMLVPLVYVPYFWLYMLICLVHLLWLGRGRNVDLSDYVMKPKLAETRRAIHNSKYNTPCQPQHS